MRQFAALFADLDASTATTAKVDALVRYFAAAQSQGHEADAAWATYFLAGGKPRAVVNARALREFALAASGLPDWLFEESYQAVGDLAETIAHLLPPPRRRTELGLAQWIEERLLPLRGAAPAEVLARLAEYVDELDPTERFLLIKLIGGGFRVGVSKLLVTRALARHGGVDAKQVAQRLIGYTDIAHLPSAARYRALVGADDDPAAERGGTPYPFFLAHQLAVPLDQFGTALGAPADWLVEWKYDGIRGQLVRRDGDVWLWSRGEELVTERFPEIAQAARALPDGTVLDGEVLVWDADAEHPAPFARLQTRVTRKTVSAKLLQQNPAAFVAYDLLEWAGADLRTRPQRERRARLQALFAPAPASAGAGWGGGGDSSHALRLEASPTPDSPASESVKGSGAGGLSPAASAIPAGETEGAAGAATPLTIVSPTLRLSPRITAATWPELATLREQSRARQVEGFMLKHMDAQYGVGRTKEVGTWWKWKIDPMSVDAVLVYAQRGHGRRASLYTDYTFAVWDRAPHDAAEAQASIDGIAAGETPASLQARGLPVLVPFAKAYSGLTDEEIRQVDAVIRKTTLEKFGPVRTVVPSLVFTLGFEGIQASPRHKSGIAVRFPRMLHWRLDKPLAEADTLASLQALLTLAGEPVAGTPDTSTDRDEAVGDAMGDLMGDTAGDAGGDAPA